jgi:catechol 2,3-dioxygenase-like lactoylglutathione lyase family enzyme
MPYRISRLGLVEIRSLDLDRDLDYYLNVLGLQLTAREGKTAYLKGWDERHAYSFALTDSDRAGMVRMAFRTVDPEDLDYYEKRLKDFGICAPSTTPLADPGGLYPAHLARPTCRAWRHWWPADRRHRASGSRLPYSGLPRLCAESRERLARRDPAAGPRGSGPPRGRGPAGGTRA